MPAADSGFGSNNPFRRNTTASFTGQDPSSAPSGSVAAPSSSFLAAAAALSPSSSAPRPPPPLTTFKSAAAVAEDSHVDSARADRDSVQPKPKKIVKRVRVQSPPPSSPEDAVPVGRYPPLDDDVDSDDTNSDTSHDAGERADPFSSGDAAELNRSAVHNEPPVVRPPANPFSKTLQDLEHNALGQDNGAGGSGKGSLDVDSFKRLLLTGQTTAPGAGVAGSSMGLQQATAIDGASNTDASSASRQSLYENVQETPRTSHEISDPEESKVSMASPLATAQPPSGRKPPPPPSSRHGKLIKMELGAENKAKRAPNSAISINTDTANSAPTRKSSIHSLTQSSPGSSDVNKPLPPPPLRSPGEEDVVSPFDREAAGKVPESLAALTTSPQAPTSLSETSRARSTSQSSTLTTSSSHRKPAAPPPRRHGHGRTDSKPSSILSDRADEDPPRSSLESNRSRADSIRVNINFDKNSSAPAPPPPRRPNHARKGSSLASPTLSTFSQVNSPGSSDDSRSPGVLGFNPMERQAGAGSMPTVTHSKDGLPKLSPPPPPPTRHASLRRPSSAHSTDASPLRKVSREKDGGVVPPPPPPRSRGASRASSNMVDSQHSSGRLRAESEATRLDEEPVTTQDTQAISETGTPADPGAGDDIMEQLRALQQEVEAARKASGSS
ncbi:hypothetical protein PFICI_03160 [Pestalotiopsis fici W106-1]|uniref:DZF domain-containing protein n=1 Tax=Pestalotiopsis fici (strain W106-1 / CGMCC3.15140) TaxID=1229662 RepID=W3XGH7_PESFW|nr:uncharacterized protein PFICI_03160 [Pestalotiopsis fici W106-1]ETS85135.1 hypothetical protein PFICI_03160 [Pestalotiopsis fici W106-1]